MTIPNYTTATPPGEDRRDRPPPEGLTETPSASPAPPANPPHLNAPDNGARGSGMVALTETLLDGIPKSGPTDPIEYYRRPLVGHLFRERINLGLRLLPARRFESALEVGYGAGALLLAVAPSVNQLRGIDLDADPDAVTRLLASRNHQAELVRGSVLDLPYDAGAFDLVYSFSVFEHLHEYEKALGEVARVLQPGGLFLLGMPSVNKSMEVAFSLLGFRGIEHHHVTTPRQVEHSFEAAGLVRKKYDSLRFPGGILPGPRLYHCWLLEKQG